MAAAAVPKLDADFLEKHSGVHVTYVELCDDSGGVLHRNRSRLLPSALVDDKLKGRRVITVRYKRIPFSLWLRL
jgi:hypothetical protein